MARFQRRCGQILLADPVSYAEQEAALSSRQKNEDRIGAAEEFGLRADRAGGSSPGAGASWPSHHLAGTSHLSAGTSHLSAGTSHPSARTSWPQAGTSHLSARALWSRAGGPPPGAGASPMVGDTRPVAPKSFQTDGTMQSFGRDIACVADAIRFLKFMFAVFTVVMFVLLYFQLRSLNHLLREGIMVLKTTH